MNDKRTCERCRFWHRDEPENQYGQCRRHPPMVMPHGLMRPMMAEDNYCGEWRDKSITQEQEQRAELVTQFALVIVHSDNATCRPNVLWEWAEKYVDARPEIGGGES